MATGVVNAGVYTEGFLSKSVAGSADVTLTAAEANNGCFHLTGAIGAAINVIIPFNGPGHFFVRNATTGNFTLTVKGPSGTGIAVAGNNTHKGALLHWDGTNVTRITADLDYTV